MKKKSGEEKAARAGGMSAAARRKFFTRLRELNPEPTTELRYGNAYQLLVAVVLSAQATDVGVNAATEGLFREVSTPEGMLALGEGGLSERIRTIGLWRGKARNVIALSRILLDKHGGEVPGNREDLEELPGVGRKTANVILNTAFGEETMAVDTHIYRVANRTGMAPGRTVREVEENLLSRVPAEFLRRAHHWLILHGRYVCKARRPECGRCEVKQWCAYPEKNAAG